MIGRNKVMIWSNAIDTIRKERLEQFNSDLQSRYLEDSIYFY